MHRPHHQLRCEAVSPDGKTLASGAVEGRVRLFDLETFRERPIPEGHIRWVSCAALSPDGRTLLTGGPDTYALLWDLKTGKELHKLDWFMHYWIESAAFTPDGKTAIVGGHNAVRLWDVATGKLTRELKGEVGIANTLAVSADGKQLAAWGSGGAIATWDLESGKLLKLKPIQYYGDLQLSFTRDGRLTIWGFRERALRWWEWETDNELAHFDPHGIAPIKRYRVSPDGRAMAAVHSDGTLRLWETLTALERSRLPQAHVGEIKTLGFTPDGRHLLTGGADCTAIVWDLRNEVRPAAKLTDAELADGWFRLGSFEAAAAYDAIRKLASDAEQAAPYLDKCLRGVDDRTRTIAKYITDLDSNRFVVREQATKALKSVGVEARPQLERALQQKPSPEVRRRVEDILASLPKPEAAPPYLREVRAIEALERMGTQEARKVLERLAGGAAEDRVTREAKAALVRLGN
jgi:WD40 repeat protein